MRLTKTRLVIITIALTMAFFTALFFLPDSVLNHRDDNLLLFIPKVLFLAITAAVTIVIILIVIFRKEYIKSQLDTFNRFKYYLMLLVKRDFNAKYRKSVLGVLWSLLHPILLMLVMTLVFSTVFRFAIEYFPVYLLSGQLIWGFFSESTGLAMNSVIASEGVIKKVYVPKYIFPLSRVISSLVNMLFSLIAFFLVVLVTGSPLSWTMLLIPIPIIFIFVFSLGVAMLISSIAVFFRDLTYLYGIFTLLLMYLSAIFWPIEILEGNILSQLMGLNPLYLFITYFRNLAYWGTIPDLWANFACIAFALSSFCLGTYVFIKQQDKFILNL